MKHINTIILAAGKGTRMKSDLPKVLHTILNRPLLEYVLRAAIDAGSQEQIVVIGHGGDEVRQTLSSLPLAPGCRFVEQQPQLGTGHAAQIALPHLDPATDAVLILCGDTPLLQADTLQAFMDHFAESGAVAAVLSSLLADPHGYGRIIRDKDGNLQGIVEQKDASPAEQSICEVNTGIYCFKPAALQESLKTLTNDNAQGEYYLTDTVAALQKQGQPVIAVCLASPEETLGINDRLQLAVASKLLQHRVNSQWMLDGVTIIDPGSTYIDADVSIGADTVLEPQTYIRAGSRIGKNCRIGIGTEITASTLGEGVRTQHAIIVESEIGDNCDIGPFAYIRPGSKLANKVKAGHFVELKKAQVGEGSKIPHLSYVGDAIVGKGANIGCGTVTCNYDGIHKHTTIIGDEAFIGSNTNLVAPVSIGKRATTGAGSTITQDVPDNALAVERAEQKHKEDWWQKKHQ